MYDTVLDSEMNVIACKPEEQVRRRVESGKIPNTWAFILVGETKKVITVSEYANRERFAAVLKVVERVLERQSTRPYKGVARRLYAERVTKEIIDLI